MLPRVPLAAEKLLDSNVPETQSGDDRCKPAATRHPATSETGSTAEPGVKQNAGNLNERREAERLNAQKVE